VTEEIDRRKIDEQKRIFYAVTQAWLDDKFATFGRWTAKSLLAIIFIMLLKVIFHLNASDLRSVLEITSTAHDVIR
jgi:hypothetical protein